MTIREYRDGGYVELPEAEADKVRAAWAADDAERAAKKLDDDAKPKVETLDERVAKLEAEIATLMSVLAK